MPVHSIALDWHAWFSMAAVSLVAGVLSYLSCYLALRMAKRYGMIVQPGERQSHELATPTGGGLGLIFSLLVTTAGMQIFFLPLPTFWWLHMLPGVVILAAAGWFDDRQHISSLVRLLIQLVVSFWLLSFICFQNPVINASMCAGIIVAMIWLMNLYNFMDGSNGMAGFQGVFAGLVMAVLFLLGNQFAMAMLSLAVAACCAGFLPLNFPRASVFMGDVASVPLGFIFASLAVHGWHTGAISPAQSILIMSVFFVDATLTLLARVFAGERWYTAHNQHVYQRLIAQGWSHSRVLVIYQAINVILVLPAIALAVMYTQFAIVTVGLTLLILGACWYTANWTLGMRATRRLE